MSFRAVLVAGTAAAVVFAACGGTDTDNASSAPTEAPTVTESATPTTTAGTDDSTDAAPDAESTDAESAESTVAPTTAAADAPELLRFTSSLVGGGEFDAASTAGTPTAFWFWAPT